jgi:hypothetical protein
MADDLEKIPNQSGVLRRIASIFLRSEPGTGKRRLTSGAFKDREMSADAESLMAIDGVNWNFSLRKWPDAYLVRLNAGFLRGKGQIIEHRPNPSEQPDNPYHCEVIGTKNGNTPSAIRDAVEWIKKPPDLLLV